MKKYVHSSFWLKLILCCLIGLCVQFSIKADDFKLQANIFDKITKQPISNVVCYVLVRVDNKYLVKDGAKIPFKGKLIVSLPAKPEKGQYRLQIIGLPPKDAKLEDESIVMTDLIQYETKELAIEIPENVKNEYTLPNIYLERHKNKKLKEVSVNATKIMFYHKGDTLIYNADAFMLPDGSMLDGLLRQMPGVELRGDGVVVCNGRKVHKLLLNGKDLFNGQRELMLENIAAYTIKEIAFYDKTGLKSKIMGESMPRDSEYTLDVRLKKEYSGGFTLNGDGGYGTRNRYLGKAFGLMYGDAFSLSARGVSNNLSDVNKPKKIENIWNPSSISAGKITHSLGGLTYYATGAENRWEIKGNADFIAKKSDLSSETQNEFFIDDGVNQYQTIKNKPLTRSRAVVTDHEFLTMIGKKTYLKIIPSFSYSQKTETSLTNLYTTTDPSLSDLDFLISSSSFINRMVKELQSDNDELKTSLRVNSSTGFGESRRGSMLTLDFNCNYLSHTSDRVEKYALTTGAGEEMLTQLTHGLYKNNPNYKLQARGSISFFKYIFKIPTSFDYEYIYTENKKTQSAFQPDSQPDYNESFRPDNLGIYNENNKPFIAAQSYNSLEKGHNHIFSFNPQVIRCDLPNGRTRGMIYSFIKVDINRRTLNYFCNDTRAKFSRTVILPIGRISWHIAEPGWQTNISFQYEKRNFDIENFVSFPSSNPLQIYKGNSSLKLTDCYMIDLRFEKESAAQKRSTLSAYAEFLDKPVAYIFNYDTHTGIRTYTPTNGKHRIYANLSYEIITPLDAPRKFNLTSKTTLNFNQNQFRVYDITHYTARENLKIKWQYNHVRINAFADALFDAAKYNEQAFNNRFSIMYGVDGAIDLPYGFFVSTDISFFTRRGFYNSELNTTDLVWNAKISKSVLKGKLIFALIAYDMFHQVSNVTFATNNQYRSETLTYGVPSFVLLQIQFRFNKQPKRH